MNFTKNPETAVLHSGYRADPTTSAVAVRVSKPGGGAHPAGW